MKCCVINCNNNEKTTSKRLGISFHSLPTDLETRSRWLSCLTIQGDVNEDSLICSEHFTDHDFYYTKSGTKHIRSDAYPISQSFEDLEVPAAYSVCRICLSSDSKMFVLKELNLNQFYQQLTGLVEDMALPQVVCYECRQRLRSANTLRNKAIKSYTLLSSVYNGESNLTIKDVKKINRHENKLTSNLTQTICESTDSDPLKIIKNEMQTYTFEYNGDNDDEVKDNENIDTEIIDSEFLEVQILDNDMIDKDNIDNEMTDDDDVENDDSTDKEDVDSSDDSVLNELLEEFKLDIDKVALKKYQKKKTPKKKNEYVEKQLKIVRKRDSTKKKKNAVVDKKNTAVATRLDSVLDESLFTITKLTQEEQIREMEQRQESKAYKKAPYKCTECYRGYRWKGRYDVHMLIHSEQSGAFECSICKKRMKTAHQLRRHVSAHHTEKYACKRCPFVTKHRTVAKTHERWHAGCKYKCPHCPAVFEKRSTYFSHLRLKHVSDFICSHCGYSFVSQKGIDAHKTKKHKLDIEIIPEDGPYCEACDVKFISEEAYSRHLRLSSRHITDGHPNKITNDSQFWHIKQHRNRWDQRRRPAKLTHHRLLTCEQCGLQLSSVKCYINHFKKEHPGVARTKYLYITTPCMCDQCGRLFPSTWHLEQHMWIHTGEKSFKCSICPKSFTAKATLEGHERRFHNGIDTRYECEVCGKQFTYDSNRKRHMVVHTALKPHKCDVCGKSFKTAAEHRAHVDHVHLKKPWPKRVRKRGGLQDKAGED